MRGVLSIILIAFYMLLFCQNAIAGPKAGSGGKIRTTQLQHKNFSTEPSIRIKQNTPSAETISKQYAPQKIETSATERKAKLLETLKHNSSKSRLNSHKKYDSKTIADTPEAQLVPPEEVNFSQRTINRKFDTPDGKRKITQVVKDGPEQVKEFPPIEGRNVNGQLVVTDGNSRLYVARKTKAEEIKMIVRTDQESAVRHNKRARYNGLGREGTNRSPTPR